MKKFEELTNDQVFTVAAIALQDITSWSNLHQILSTGYATDTKLRVEKDIWNKDPELSVYRVYVDGMGNTWCAIWETDDENKIDVTVVEDKEVADVANSTVIVKKLMEWGFVEGPNYLVEVRNPIQEAIKQIKEDPELYRAWKDNIAMAFKDEYNRQFNKALEYRTELRSPVNIHEVANIAAENFLNLLCREQT